MCNLVTCGHNNSTNSSGVGVDDVLALVGGVVVIAVGGSIVSTAPGFFAVLGLVMLVLAPNWSRRLVGRALRLLLLQVRPLLREMRRSWRTRQRRPVPLAAPSTALAVARPWHATLTAITPTGPVELTRGQVMGTWSSAAECEAEVCRKALRAYIEQGMTPPGQLCCRAEPVAGGGR